MNFELLNYISIDNGLCQKLADLSDKDEPDILRLSKKYFNGNSNCLLGKKPLIRLAVILKAAEMTYQLYMNKGISKKIFSDTFDDIRIWCENCGNEGIVNSGWLKNHIAFELFKIGRLQFQMFTCSSKALCYSKLPLKLNEKAVYVHIPQGEKLDYDECRKSLSQANAFFKRYFPEFKFNYYFCESWLLFENNRLFMNENSNIIKFMSLFDIHYSLEHEAQPFERIFSSDINRIYSIPIIGNIKRKNNIALFSEATSLQKSAKEYLLKGNRLGIGIGTIPKERCKA